LTGYQAASPSARQNGVSFGRYVISAGEAQYRRVGNSFDGPNAGRVGGGYQRDSIPSSSGGDEFIELKYPNAPLNCTIRFPTNTTAAEQVGYFFPPMSRAGRCCWWLR
jgi:hypothetical protein